MYVLFFVIFCVSNNAVAQLVRLFFGEAFIVPTRGMSPTILPGELTICYHENPRSAHCSESPA